MTRENGRRRLICGLVLIGMLVACGAVRNAEAQEVRPGRSGNEIVRLIGVGSVLTADGTVWLFRPDRNQWTTVDESFRADGRETHILPLPVPPSEIEDMATFGFILTTSGTCWLYNMESDQWQKLPLPPSR